MKAQPKVMYMSGDGSLYVKDISWQAWGSGSTFGRGSAELNNCKPDCANGTFQEHSATINLSKPKPWHNEMAYTSEEISVPATNWRYTFTRNLLPGAESPIPVASPPTPGPASTQATLSGQCTMGYEPAYIDSSGNIAYGPFTIGQPPGAATINGQSYAPTSAYQVSLTNNGTTTAQAGGWAVAFYDASGSELGSDQESAGNTFITANQTLTWTMYSGTTTDDSGLSSDGVAGTQDDNIPASGAATCSFLQWYQP